MKMAEHFTIFTPVKDIVLQAVIGEETKEVRLTNASGSGEGYHIMIGKGYHGVVTKMLDGRHVYLNPNSWLTPEDCGVIIKSVDVL